MGLTINSAQYNSNAEYETVTGEIVTINNAKPYVRMKQVVAEINPVQSGSGDPSPDNVRPISGWSEAKVTRTEKNVLRWYAEGETKTQASVTGMVQADGGIKLTGTASGTWCGNSSPTCMLKAGTYTINQEGTSVSGIQTYLVNHSANTVIAYVSGINQHVTFTLESDTLIHAYNKVSNGTVTDCTIYSWINLGSTATAYEPYNGNTYTIDLDGTRYGAELDVTRGKLRVTHGYVVLNGSETWYELLSGGTRIGFRNSGTTDMPGRKANGQFLCNRLVDKGGSMSDLVNTWDMVWATNLNIRTDNLFADTDAFKAWVASNNLECVYELDTPVEVDLTPTEITTLLGINNVWSDTGDIEVEYCADTKRYIQKLISQLA